VPRYCGQLLILLRLDGVACEHRLEIAHTGMLSRIATRSASAANSPVRLRKHSVRLVDVDALAELAQLQVLVSVAEAAQAVACSDTDSWLVARLVLGRGRLVVA